MDKLLWCTDLDWGYVRAVLNGETVQKAVQDMLDVSQTTFVLVKHLRSWSWCEDLRISVATRSRWWFSWVHFLSTSTSNYQVTKVVCNDLEGPNLAETLAVWWNSKGTTSNTDAFCCGSSQWHYTIFQMTGNYRWGEAEFGWLFLQGDRQPSFGVKLMMDDRRWRIVRLWAKLKEMDQPTMKYRVMVSSYLYTSGGLYEEHKDATNNNTVMSWTKSTTMLKERCCAVRVAACVYVFCLVVA